MVVLLLLLVLVLLLWWYCCCFCGRGPGGTLAALRTCSASLRHFVVCAQQRRTSSFWCITVNAILVLLSSSSSSLLLLLLFVTYCRYACKDPAVIDGIDVSDECLGLIVFPTWIGDGYCDDVSTSASSVGYNTKRCGWDGGDCCRDTCNDGAQHHCGDTPGYVCLDENFEDFCDAAKQSCVLTFHCARAAVHV